VWEIETKLPRTTSDRSSTIRAVQSATSHGQGMTEMVNGIYNGSRFEDVRLDK
jgi:hypothetical protein